MSFFRQFKTKESANNAAKPAKKRGHPKKNDIAIDATEAAKNVEMPKRKRGRPKKVNSIQMYSHDNFN